MGKVVLCKKVSFVDFETICQQSERSIYLEAVERENEAVLKVINMSADKFLDEQVVDEKEK